MDSGEGMIDPGEIPPNASMNYSYPEWFAVQTRYRYEKSVAEQLNRKKCEVYLPLRMEHHRWSDRKQLVTRPLFPGYAFVRIDRSPAARRPVLQTAGLIGFVNFGGLAIPVPQKQIEDLQLLLKENELFSIHSLVHAGQRVRVRGGSLHGLEGVLTHQEKGKLLISIESIHRSLAIEIHGYELETI
jgi:transcription antitermination factor NusG